MLIASLARHLAALGHGTYDVVDASIRLEGLPTDPVAAVSIGYFPTPIEDPLNGIAVEGIQIIVRDPGTTDRVRDGYERALQVRDDLNGLRNTTIAVGTPDEARILSLVGADSGPTSLGDDTEGRLLWSLRFIAQTPHDTAHTIV